MSHDGWHDFDVERGYEVKSEDGGQVWRIRDRDGVVTVLTAEEFNQLRTSGENPRGLS